ncbi:MAG: hypothetical protein AAFV43_14660 [Planctomycetota bacterium]
MSTPVVWEPGAVADIDTAWASLSESGRQRLEAAVEEINNALGSAAVQLGESRSDRLTRVLVRSPLTVHYRVVDRLGLVRVLAAQVHRPSP